jgi:16S rRNA (guanine(966)-N(2))-methyltransferase RsmD
MRIISGKFRSRRINAPANLPIRPTTDFAKEGLFNVINNFIDFTEVSVLDLFSGTGSITYEFLSRGCKEATTVEMNPKCIEFMHKTKELLKLDNLYIVKGDAFAYLNHCHKTFDVIFADPPYEMEKINELPDLIIEKKILHSGGWLIVEHSADNNFAEHPRFFEHRNYGKVNFSIFK